MANTIIPFPDTLASHDPEDIVLRSKRPLTSVGVIINPPGGRLDDAPSWISKTLADNPIPNNGKVGGQT